MQLKAKRHFLHEHPERSTAWKMPELVQFMLRPEVGSTVLHMCAFGMTATDEQGEAPVHKATRVMSSSEEILKRLDIRCSNELGGERHRHVHLVQGRARLAQVYPRLFGIRVCEGIAAQKKIEALGVSARPIMTLEEMQKTAEGMKAGECPSAALH